MYWYSIRPSRARPVSCSLSSSSSPPFFLRLLALSPPPAAAFSSSITARSAFFTRKRSASAVITFSRITGPVISTNGREISGARSRSALAL